MYFIFESVLYVGWQRGGEKLLLEEQSKSELVTNIIGSDAASTKIKRKKVQFAVTSNG